MGRRVHGGRRSPAGAGGAGGTKAADEEPLPGNRTLNRVLTDPAGQGAPDVAQATGASNTAAQKIAVQDGRFSDEEMVRMLGSLPSMSASAVDSFRFSGLHELEQGRPRAYAIVKARMVAIAGQEKFDQLYAHDARIARLLGWNAKVAAKLVEFVDYYRATKQPTAADYVSELVAEYEWTYADLTGLYLDSGDKGLRLREILAAGHPYELVQQIVTDAEAAQAEQIRLEAIAARAETWSGRHVATKQRMIRSNLKITLTDLLEPRPGTETETEAVAWARISGSACAVVPIDDRYHVFALSESLSHGDIFFVEEWEEARSEVVPVASTPPGTLLTTTDGYLLTRDGERFFGGALARTAEARLTADEALLAEHGEGLGSEQAVNLFKRMTMDLLMTNLAAAEQRLRDQLALIYQTPWEWIDRVRGLYPGTWQRILKPRAEVGAKVAEDSAYLRELLIEAADFTASVADRELTEDEQTEVTFILERIGRIYSESPLAAMMVITDRDAEDTGPAEEDDYTDTAAGKAPAQVAGLAAAELFERLENIDTVRKHFFRNPDAVLDLEPLHEAIIDGFDGWQRLWIRWEVVGHGLSELAKAVGMAAFQLGLIVTGLVTGGLTSMAALGTSTAVGAAGVQSSFESARLVTAMSALDLKGGFQLASPEDAASARRWAYIGLALTVLDAGGFVAAGRLVGRLSRVAQMPDVAAALAGADETLGVVARQLGMSERTLVRQLETLTGPARAQLVDKIKSVLAVRLAGTAEMPLVVGELAGAWTYNPGRAVRTLDEAVDLARRAGVTIEDDVVFEIVPHATLQRSGKGVIFGDYTDILRHKKYRAGDFVDWDDLFVGDAIRVRLSDQILASDEAIVAVLGHEMHEVNGLRKLFEANEFRLRADQLFRRIEPGFKGNLHWEAWGISDKLVMAMRKAAKP